MENKYYTPELLEFHVGFEFEQFENNNWQQTTLESDGAERFFVMLNTYESQDFVRVKHLDREDIESLGWHKHQETYFSFENKKIKSHSNEYFLNEILVLSNSYFLEITDFCIIIQDYDYEVIFKGTIKNKSELKKIMQMLNIE